MTDKLTAALNRLRDALAALADKQRDLLRLACPLGRLLERRGDFRSQAYENLSPG